MATAYSRPTANQNQSGAPAGSNTAQQAAVPENTANNVRAASAYPNQSAFLSPSAITMQQQAEGPVEAAQATLAESSVSLTSTDVGPLTFGAGGWTVEPLQAFDRLDSNIDQALP
ncbi:hypothetical protein ACHAQH_008898 [Verticillium albo-atrum]